MSRRSTNRDTRDAKIANAMKDSPSKVLTLLVTSTHRRHQKRAERLMTAANEVYKHNKEQEAMDVQVQADSQ